MINPNYLKYIPDAKKDDIHNNLIIDVYYFYHGIKPNADQKIICMNNNIFDLNKENLKLVNIDIFL